MVFQRCLNPAPVDYIVTRVYESITHLVLSRHEAASLATVDDPEELNPEKGLEGLKKAAQHFLSLKVKNVVIRLGDRGAYYATSEGDMDLIVAKAVKKTKDTTGAG